MEPIKQSQTKFYLVIFFIILVAALIGAGAVFLLRPQTPMSPHGGEGIQFDPHGGAPTAQTPAPQPQTQEREAYPVAFNSTNVVHNAQMRYGLNLRAVEYLWEFGDGQTSTERNPTHEYKAQGTYTAKLTVTLEDGSTYSETTPVTVKPR